MLARRVRRLTSDLDRRDRNARQELALVDLLSHVDVPTADRQRLQLTRNVFQILSSDEAERLVADVENVVGPVQVVKFDLLDLAAVDADQLAPVPASWLLHDPLAIRNVEGGLLDDVLVLVVVAVVVPRVLLAGHDVRVEHPLLLHVRTSLKGV